MMRKGMGTIGQVFLFSLIMITFISGIVLASAASDQNVFDRQVNKQVNYQLVEVKQNSIMTVMMEDYLWRHPDISYDKYGNMKFKKLVSLYYSTDGSIVYIGRDEYQADNAGPEDSVRQDIYDYVKFKMDKYWVETSSPTNYSVLFRSGGSARNDLRVGPVIGEGTRTLYTLPKNDGGQITMIVEVQAGNSVIGVEPE